MFSWKEKRPIDGETDKLCLSEGRNDGYSRRATSILPLPQSSEKREIEKTEFINHQKLLLSFEAHQKSGCLRIVSPKKKSRSAMLIYRGRVIGCIYGSKNHIDQLFGETARTYAIADLAQSGNLMDSYTLGEEVVLSAAALFHGEILLPQERSDVKNNYQQIFSRMKKNHSTGSVVITNNEHLAVCLTYVFNGEIIGVYSLKDKWLDATYEAGLNCLLGTDGASVSASALSAACESEALDLTFSLTGLDGAASNGPDDPRFAAGGNLPHLVLPVVKPEELRALLPTVLEFSKAPM